MTFNYKDSPEGIQLQIEKSVTNQLYILLSTVLNSNLDSHISQIEYILSNSSPSIKFNYINKLLSVIKLIDLNSLHPLITLLKQVLNPISFTLSHIEDYQYQLGFLLENSSVYQSLDLNPAFSLYLIAINFKPDFIPIILNLVSELPKFIKSIDCKFDHLLFLKTTLSSKFPVSAKILILTCFEPIIDYHIKLLINPYIKSGINMSFKDILVEVKKDVNLPTTVNHIITSILKAGKSEIDLSLVILVLELLIPGSQKIPSNPLKFLSNYKSFPESTALGTQLKSCFSALDQEPDIDIDWLLIFSKVQDFLSSSNVSPSILAINQFITAIDYKPEILDMALNIDWHFKTQLLYTCLTNDPKQGAYDITSSPFLTKCFDDIQTPIEAQIGKRNAISFINIGRLELKIMNQITTQNGKHSPIDSEIIKLFDHHCVTFIEYLLCACITLIQDGDSFIDAILTNLFKSLLSNDGRFVKNVIEKFNEKEPITLNNKLFEFYNSRKTTDSILSAAKPMMELKLFDSLLSYSLNMNFIIGLNLAIYSSVLGYDYKPLLESLLADTNKKPTVVQGLHNILEIKSAEDANLTVKTKVLGVATVYHLLNVVTKNAPFVPGEKLKALQLQLLTAYPRLINFGCGHDQAILENDKVSNLFPESVEQEMKGYYSKMYNRELEIKDIVEMLINFKSSDVPHDQDIFACMIHSLLDEYRFFSEYPLTALASTSLLFGALLQKDIIQGTTLTVALNFIWESCNQPQDSHLFKFAVQALYNFKSRLHEYPNYCKHLLECNSLSAHAKMYEIVLNAANGIPCGDQPLNTSRPNSSSGQPMVMNSRSEDEGLKYQSITPFDQTIGIPQEKPNEQVSDKLLFFINNLTGDNLTTKLAEVRDALTENFFLWFADYLVGDRAKSEPNNHQLYCQLIKEFNNPIFYEYVLSVSLREVNYLIRNFKDTSTERSHLKNLGSWLGQITLASDRPLKRNHIGLKFLLVEAYDFNTLPFVIPFVCKILDQAKFSKIFNLPNPWVLGVIQVLVELYDCANLKLNLKFEIEVLLNSFNMKISDVEPSTIVRSHNRNPQALASLFGIKPNANGLTNDFAKLGIDNQAQIPANQFQPNQMTPQQLMQQQQQQQQLLQLHLQQQQQAGVLPREEALPIPGQPQPPQQPPQTQPVPQGQPAVVQPAAGGLDTSFSTLVGNTIFTTNPNLRRAFQASLSRAVRECAIPILSKTSESVITTTEALIRKDFSYEGDVTKLRKSYQTMVIKLAQSIIGSSGRKILIETIEAFMIQLLANQLNPNDIPLGELGAAIQANVDLCVDIVNKIAVGNIIDLIEEKMRASVAEREQLQPGQSFVETGANGYALNLHPPLGLTPDGLSQSQQAVYENFGSQISRPNVSSTVASSQIPPGPVPQQPGSVTAPQVPMAVPPQTPQQVPNVPSQGLPVEEAAIVVDQLFATITQTCEKAIAGLADLRVSSLAEIPQDHLVTQCVTNILAIAQSNALKYPELLLKVAQYAVNCLFTQAHENPVSNEIYVVILDKLCEYSPSTAKDVTWWLVHSPDQRKLNVPVMFSLLRVQLVQPSKLDSTISKLINETKNPLVVQFASTLLIKVFGTKTPKPIALRTEFALTLKSLTDFEGDESAAGYQEAIEARANLFTLLESDDSLDGDHLYSQLGYIFTEWHRLCIHSESDNALKNEFIAGLLKSEVLTDPDTFSMFFKVAINISVTAFATEHEIRSRTQHESLLAIDSLCSLIVEIITKFDVKHVDDAMAYLKNIMGVILVAFTNDHESVNGQWNERAYFKFFSSLLCYYNDASMFNKDATTHMDSQFFNLIGNILNALQPVIFPGFTFAWISLISHRMFLPRLLDLSNNEGHNTLVKILSSLLKFESVYSLDESVNHDVISVIFKAINRIFVGIYHDYPEFLAENYLSLLLAVPPSYIQIRNIILSATPRSVELENPFKPGLKVDRIEDIKNSPTINYHPQDDIAKSGLKRSIENYLRIPGPGLVKTLYNGVKLSKPKPTKEFEFDSVNYNVGLINSLVLYVTLSYSEEKNSGAFNGKDPHVTIFVDLLNIGSTEFKFHLINALANQLRYPNTHTHWLMGILLHLFSGKTNYVSNETKLITQEVITRVLIERHIVNKPHQWGLTILLTELVKNENYNLFELPFVKNAPAEIKLIFDALLNNISS